MAFSSGYIARADLIHRIQYIKVHNFLTTDICASWNKLTLNFYIKMQLTSTKDNFEHVTHENHVNHVF